MSSEIGINQLKRRDFLKAGLVFGAGASGLAAGYAAVPDAFARAVYAAKQEGVSNDNVLVMIQLAGGNDGLRTLVPLSDPTLHDLRPMLSGPMVSKALPLSADFGLNHNLGGIKSLWDKGKVAIVQGVGYDNPTFSHFESIRIWETGDPTRRQVDGWLGRTLAKAYDSNGHPLTGCACGATDVPGALRDLQATMSVIQNQKTFGFTGGSEVEAAVGALYKGTPGIYGALFDTAIATANETITALRTSSASYQPMASYTDSVKLVYSSKNQLAAALQLAAELIVTGTGVKLLHVTLGGFDTHYTELNRPRRPDGLPRLCGERLLSRSGGAWQGAQRAHRDMVGVRQATDGECKRRHRPRGGCASAARRRPCEGRALRPIAKPHQPRRHRQPQACCRLPLGVPGDPERASRRRLRRDPGRQVRPGAIPESASGGRLTTCASSSSGQERQR